MFKGIGNIASLMKQASQLSGNLGQISDELRSKTVTGVAGGGLVEVEANGLQQILKVDIDPMLIDKQDKEMIEELLPAAINDAIAKCKALHMDSMREVTGNVPGLDEALAKFSGESDPTVDP